MRVLVALCLSFIVCVVSGLSDSSAMAASLSNRQPNRPIGELTIAQAPRRQPTTLQNNVPPTQILSRLFTEPELQRVWFADSFLAQISLAEISQIVQGIQGSVGDYQSIEDVDNGFVLTFSRGSVPAHLALNNQGQITGLLFETPQLSALSLSELQAEFAALPGQVHVLAMRSNTQDGDEGPEESSEKILALNADQPLAVGSTFKLFVLDALQRKIAAGEHQWDDVITLKNEWKSLPSGFLQTWPAGSQLTLESLATLMISQSDNTATDHVFNLVGRDAVEDAFRSYVNGESEGQSDTRAKERNHPFLTTREFFVLKDPANVRILRRWRRSNERKSILSALPALPLPDVNLFNAGPQAIDVEWFFSARELCSVMNNVAQLPLMNINPGLVNPDDWQRVAFKGGSEPGVENFTTALIDTQGQHFCVSATWNNEAGIDELRFSTLYRSLIETMR